MCVTLVQMAFHLFAGTVACNDEVTGHLKCLCSVNSLFAIDVFVKAQMQNSAVLRHA